MFNIFFITGVTTLDAFDSLSAGVPHPPIASRLAVFHIVVEIAAKCSVAVGAFEFFVETICSFFWQDF